jgi:carbonic anhydrase/acetyltransferase-like protein (isoleucine patch superfamily)
MDFEMLEDRLDQGQEVFIAPGTHLIGHISLGDQASVWYNTVLRADLAPIRIGARSNVQDNCVFHVETGMPCTLGDDVTVGHSAVVHAATIGNNVLIGMKAIIMSGATIGDNCVIGAGALITENQVIPPGTLVWGMPAKRSRALDEAEIAALQLSSAHYVEYARFHIQRVANEG